MNGLVKRLLSACKRNFRQLGNLGSFRESAWACAIVLAGVLLTNVTASLFHLPSSLSVFSRAFQLAGFDSWGGMEAAYNWFKAHPHDKLYQNIFFGERVKFQYPPSSLLPWYVADVLHLHLSYYRMNLISLVFFVLSAIGTAMTAVEAAVQLHWRPGDRAARWGLGILGVIACLFYYPMIKSFQLGQIQAWLNCWLIWACYFWMKDRRLVSGLLIGAMCLFKPQLGLFLIWAILRREWRFLAGWVAIIIPGELAALMLFGWGNHMDYLKVLSFLGHHGEAYYANQSVNGLLNHMFGTAQDTLVWNEHGFPPYRAVVYDGTVLTSLAFLGFGFFYFIRRKATTVIDFMLAAVTFTIASPIAWEHHYGFMPVVFAVVFVRLLTTPSMRRGMLLGIAFTLSAAYLPGQLLPANGLGSLAQSYVFFGILALLYILYDVRDSFPPHEPMVKRQVPVAIRKYVPRAWLGLPEES